MVPSQKIKILLHQIRWLFWLSFLWRAVFRSFALESVLIRRGNLAQTGAFTNETVLTPSNVGISTFGKLFTLSVDGRVYAQPLILGGVHVPGRGDLNLLFVATLHNSLYAFDLDAAGTMDNAVVWKKSFLDPANGIVSPSGDELFAANVGPEIGVVGTPVIDQRTGTIFLVSKTKEQGTNYFNRLHALDTATGEERLGSPVLIGGQVLGNGGHSDNSIVQFDQKLHYNRAGLTIVTNKAHPAGNIYVAVSAHEDITGGHGWVFGYDVETLQNTSVKCTTPNGYLGSIWMYGAAPAADDDGYMYVMTGNGGLDASVGNFADSFVKYDTAVSGLDTVDYFAPADQNLLEINDLDLGSSGPMVLPEAVGSAQHPRLLLGAGKEGTIYLLDRDNLGQFNVAGNSQIVRELPSAIGSGNTDATYSSPAYFAGRVFYHGVGDTLKQFNVANGLITPQPVSTGARIFGFPGANPSISANGTNNAIVWEVRPTLTDSAVLIATAVDDLGRELYSSDFVYSRDSGGVPIRGLAPIISGGRVYIQTSAGIEVFGLLSEKLPTPVISPQSGPTAEGQRVRISGEPVGAEIHYTLDGTTPTSQSPLYTNTLVINPPITVIARALESGMVASETATSTYTVAIQGFNGSYWKDQLGTFNGPPTVSQIETSTLYYNQTPDLTLGKSGFSSKWTGEMLPEFTETYSITVGANGGVRLWFDGELAIDKWFIPADLTHSFTISADLIAGHRYKVELDYFKNPGDMILGLAWSSASRPYDYLHLSEMAVGNIPPTVSLIQPSDGTVLSAPGVVTLEAMPIDVDGGITNVTFFHDGIPIGSVSSAPYSITWSGIAPGTNSVYAVAYDNGGASGESGAITVAVNSGDGRPSGIGARAPAPGFLSLPHDGNSAFPPVLSQTGVFTNTGQMGFSPGIVPYAVNSPFWSDGAIKSRWLMVPFDGTVSRPDQQISFSAEGKWVYPVGSVFVKHFDYATNDLDLGSIRRLETRLIEVTTNGRVVGATYKWRPDYSDADLITNALTENLLIQTSTGIRTQLWYYPQPSDCLVCHTPESGGVLGASFTRQLNGLETYPGGVHDNQLHALNRAGYFYPAIDDTSISNYTKLAAIGDTNSTIEMRARSFLDVNCAYCHFPGGTGRAFFDARITTPLSTSGIINGSILAGSGIYHPITPGDETRSAIYLRVNTLTNETKMPPIARNSIDTEAVKVLGCWIDNLAGRRPKLVITRVPEGLRIGWDDGIAPFYLQESESLGQSLNWTFSLLPERNGTESTVLVPFSKVAKYYRLTSRSP